MGNIIKEGFIFSYLGSTSGAVSAAVIAIASLAFYIGIKLTGVSLNENILIFWSWLLTVFRKLTIRKERKYSREYEIGKITEKMRVVKNYRFLNDLIIDLGYKQKGITPYSFLFLCNMFSVVMALILSKLLFNSFWFIIIAYPLVFATLMCVLYTRANIAHDTRIDEVIEAENIICNNIQSGVVVAIRNSLDVMPNGVKGAFKNFLDNIEHKNYHIVTALQDLNQNLGSISDDFIKKCIVFETQEEHGIAGMFKDIVEINNIKTELRTNMKRKFEEVVIEFVISAIMIFVFLVGVLVVFPDVRWFYLRTPLGQIIIAIDMILLVIEFVYITYLRALEF